MGLLYGLEKLTSATYSLVGSEPLKKRLENAFMEFHPITKDDLSEALFERYNSIYTRMTSTKATGNEGNLYATLDTMTKEEQESLATEILSLAYDVNEADLLQNDNNG